MGPSWVVTSLQKSYLESSIAGGRSEVLYICCLKYEKSGNTKQDISPAIEDSNYEFWKVRHIIQLGPLLPFAWSFLIRK